MSHPLSDSTLFNTFVSPANSNSSQVCEYLTRMRARTLVCTHTHTCLSGSQNIETSTYHFSQVTASFAVDLQAHDHSHRNLNPARATNIQRHVGERQSS